MDPVTTWAFAPKDGVANHLKNCPYNIKMSHKVITKSPAWEEILKGVKDRAMSK